MLHLARGIALGMDVTNFLEFERAFERQWIIRSAAQIEHVARRRDQMRHGRDVLVMVERSVERGRSLEQVGDHLGLLRAVHQPLFDRHMRGQRGQHRELAGEGLGRGDPDLRAGVRRQQ